MRDESIDKMIEAGLASRADFNAQLTRLFIDYKTSEGRINPVALLEQINTRSKPPTASDINTDLIVTLAAKMLDNPIATFENAKNKLGYKKPVDIGLEIEHMKYEVLAAMLSFVLNNPNNEKSQALVEAIFKYGSDQDRAVLESIGRKGTTNMANQAWSIVTGFVGPSSAPTPTQIATAKQKQQKEVATLLAGTPTESDNILDALEPLLNRHGYGLILNSPQGKPEKGKIYLVKIDNTSLKYTVLDPQGNPQEGSVSIDQLIGEGSESEKYNRGRRLQEILRGTLDQTIFEEEILPGILKLAINAGHAHIDFSFLNTIQNENIKRLFHDAEDLTSGNLEKIDRLEKISHGDLRKIALEVESIRLFITSCRYALNVTGNTLTSEQKTALYRQIDNLNAALLKAQTKIVEAMVQRLDLLDPEVLKTLNASEHDKAFYCDDRTATLLKVHALTPIPDQLAKLQHISTTDIIKYLAYIAKAGTNEQRLSLFKILPDKVKLSKEDLSLWLEKKLKDWRILFNEEEKQTLIELLRAHPTLFQSKTDKEKKEMTISQEYFSNLCAVIKSMSSFNNKEAMRKLLNEVASMDIFQDRTQFKEFCTLFTATTSMGSTLFNRLYPYLGEEGSVLSLIIQIKNIENDVGRGSLITAVMEKYGTKRALDELSSLIAITTREKGSEYASMPISFLERLLEESNSLDAFLENVASANELLREMPLIALLSKSLTPNEILEIAGLKPNEGDTSVAALQNLKEHLDESDLIYAEKMIKEMQKMGLVKNKEQVAAAAKTAIDIINIMNKIINNLPQYPENAEDLKDQFSNLLVELLYFKKEYGNTPKTRSILHHLLRNLSSERNINILVENNEAYQRQELQFFIAALRRMDKYSGDEAKAIEDTSKGPAISVEPEDDRINSDERNILLVENAFEAADKLIQLQKEHEAQEKEFEELKQLASELTDEGNIQSQKEHEDQEKELKELQQLASKLTEVSTHTGHRPIETIQTANAINKLNVGTKLKIAGLNFQIAVLSFCEVFHKYPPRQRLIEKLEKQITNLRLGKASEQDKLDKNLTPAPDEGGIRTKPEDRPPPPTETLAPPITKKRPAPPQYEAPAPPEDDDNALKKQ